MDGVMELVRRSPAGRARCRICGVRDLVTEAELAEGLCAPCGSLRPPSPVIPKRFIGKTLEEYSPKTTSQQTALAAVRAWLASLKDGPMLALVGETRTGKSHLLYAAAQQLHREQGRRAYCRPWYSLGDQLRYGTHTDHPEEPWEVREKLWGEPIVMLDEVRPTSGTNFDDTELAKFACHAYDDRIAVLITTNYNPLAEVMGFPAAARFTQVVVVGPDGSRKAEA